MFTRVLCLTLLLLPGLVRAESLIATHMLAAGSVVGDGDVTLVDAEIPGALTALDPALGMEVKVAIYPGRPVLADNLTPPAVVERNQTVVLIFRQGGLAITAEGRALARGAPGDVIKVMNTGSHATVTGVVLDDGSVQVGP